MIDIMFTRNLETSSANQSEAVSPLKVLKETLASDPTAQGLFILKKAVIIGL